MGMQHQLTFMCDSCEVNYMLDFDMELPPGWIGAQFVVADSDGLIPENEQDLFNHFCCQRCLLDYCNGVEMRQRLAMTEVKRSKKKKNKPNNGDQADGDPPYEVG